MPTPKTQSPAPCRLVYYNTLMIVIHENEIVIHNTLWTCGCCGGVRLRGGGLLIFGERGSRRR